MAYFRGVAVERVRQIFNILSSSREERRINERVDMEGVARKSKAAGLLEREGRI